MALHYDSRTNSSSVWRPARSQVRSSAPRQCVRVHICDIVPPIRIGKGSTEKLAGHTAGPGLHCAIADTPRHSVPNPAYHTAYSHLPSSTLRRSCTNHLRRAGTTGQRYCGGLLLANSWQSSCGELLQAQDIAENHLSPNICCCRPSASSISIGNT